MRGRWHWCKTRRGRRPEGPPLQLNIPSAHPHILIKLTFIALPNQLNLHLYMIESSRMLTPYWKVPGVNDLCINCRHFRFSVRTGPFPASTSKARSLKMKINRTVMTSVLPIKTALRGPDLPDDYHFSEQFNVGLPTKSRASGNRYFVQNILEPHLRRRSVILFYGLSVQPEFWYTQTKQSGYFSINLRGPLNFAFICFLRLSWRDSHPIDEIRSLSGMRARCCCSDSPFINATKSCLSSGIGICGRSRVRYLGPFP